MGYIRKMAVHAIRERGESPEIVAQIFNFNSQLYLPRVEPV
jgi:hypothetical protein